MENGLEQNFIGLLKKAHRPPKHPKALRLQVAFKVFLSVPFLKKIESIFIFDVLAKVAALASLLRPYGADQGSDRLGQLHALLRNNLHSDDDQDHANRICKGTANNRKKARIWDHPLITQH